MKPAIVVSSLDYQRLHTLLDGTPAPGPAGKTRLLEELARADVVEPAEIPSNVVTMIRKSVSRSRIRARSSA